jgi:hypothetical protein
VPFFVAADPRGLAPARAQVWATAFSSRDAATAHARKLAQPCVIIAALDLAEAVCVLQTTPDAPTSLPVESAPAPPPTSVPLAASSRR